MRPRQRSRRLWIVWLVLLVLLAGIVANEMGGFFETEHHHRRTSGRVPMFSFGEPELGRIEVIYEGRSAILSRSADGEWSHRHQDHQHGHSHDHQHGKPPAEIAGQLVLITGMHADRQVAPTQGLDQYGLKTPQTMIAFYGRQGSEAYAAAPLTVLYVGDLLPTQYEYYTLREGDQKLSLIPRYYIVLLLALVFEEDQVPPLLPARESIGSN